jgi:hypothetical protein
MQVGPCIPVGVHLQKAEAGPTSEPTRRLPSHLDDVVAERVLDQRQRVARDAVRDQPRLAAGGEVIFTRPCIFI